MGGHQWAVVADAAVAVGGGYDRRRGKADRLVVFVPVLSLCQCFLWIPREFSSASCIAHRLWWSGWVYSNVHIYNLIHKFQLEEARGSSLTFDRVPLKKIINLVERVTLHA